MRSSLMRISPSTRARRSASCNRRLPSRSRCSSASRRETRALRLVTNPTLFGLAGGAVRRLFGLALGLGLRAGGLLLLLDPVVLDSAQLAQRKQDRVLTWTLAAAHGRGLTISVTRFSVDFNAASLGRSTLARKSEAARPAETHRGSKTICSDYLNDASNLSTTSSPFLPPVFAPVLAFRHPPALGDGRLRIASCPRRGARHRGDDRQPPSSARPSPPPAAASFFAADLGLAPSLSRARPTRSASACRAFAASSSAFACAVFAAISACLRFSSATSIEWCRQSAPPRANHRPAATGRRPSTSASPRGGSASPADRTSGGLLSHSFFELAPSGTEISKMYSPTGSVV